MGLATLIIFVSVLHRYMVGFQSPIRLAADPELCLGPGGHHLPVCVDGQFGAAYGVPPAFTWGGRADQPARRTQTQIFVLFGLLAGALFTGTIATMGANFVWHNGANYAFHQFFHLDMTDLIEGPTTPDLEWPTWIIYLAIPLGSSDVLPLLAGGLELYPHRRGATPRPRPR